MAWAQESNPEATSLLGRPLLRPEIAPEQRAQLEQALAKARADFEKNPADPDAAIWLGRRTAYLGRYREAIAIYSRALERHPNDARLYRHRGHRYITVRELDNAIADFQAGARLTDGKPDEVEPDGQPNPKNIPTSSLQTNIWYHLGLAHYLKGEFEEARRAFAICFKLATNDDMRVAAANWLNLSLRRSGRDAEAAALLGTINSELELIENFEYHTLLRLHKGEKIPETVLGADGEALSQATLGYGVGAWYLLNGQPEKAREVFARVLEGPQWAAFGYLAAEAELSRLR
ncbi:MAG: tetratricopeptide repeat protein [Candidatus Acidiferrales bacterium]